MSWNDCGNTFRTWKSTINSDGRSQSTVDSGSGITLACIPAGLYPCRLAKRSSGAQDFEV